VASGGAGTWLCFWRWPWPRGSSAPGTGAVADSHTRRGSVPSGRLTSPAGRHSSDNLSSQPERQDRGPETLNYHGVVLPRSEPDHPSIHITEIVLGRDQFVLKSGGVTSIDGLQLGVVQHASGRQSLALLRALDAACANAEELAAATMSRRTNIQTPTRGQNPDAVRTCRPRLRRCNSLANRCI
jgi:hypothetical protein